MSSTRGRDAITVGESKSKEREDKEEGGGVGFPGHVEGVMILGFSRGFEGVSEDLRFLLSLIFQEKCERI